MKRIFHPIGQGAFYSERHNNFNIVYDCGNWRNTKYADNVVKQSFSSEETIDILFISHFDFDHVSKIKTLKQHVKSIKNVVMPLLYDDEKAFLINIYTSLEFYDIVEIIDNPNAFFDDGCNIVKVKPTDGNNQMIDGNRINANNIPNKIFSGTIITETNHNNDWIFIPYNFAYQAHRSELEKFLKLENIDINLLTNNIDYAISKRAKIRKVYNKLAGRINQNSMIVYSGPRQGNNRRRIFRPINHRASRFIKFNPDMKPACIYTGDANLNITNINSIFSNYWNNVGTIQIPHHGDIKSFNKYIFNNGDIYCPISFGTRNNYGHPSNKLISDLLQNGNYPILVTELLNDFYIECI